MPENDKAIIIGISGPSSSGKTTLARLLQAVFSPHEHDTSTSIPGINQAFIIHEDDFYLPDNKIPYQKTITGKTIQDWDCADAYNIPLLTSTLSHLRATGSLPPGLRSIEDLNEKTESGVSQETITALRGYVSTHLASSTSPSRTSSAAATAAGAGSGAGDVTGGKTLALLEGILLFSPHDPQHVLYPVQGTLDARLFLPAAYEDVKRRREARSGYVTNGPAHEPPLPQRSTSADAIAGTGAGAGNGTETEAGTSTGTGAGNDTGAEGQERSSFWVDPPGYVDDVVWPNYALSHSWLLLPAGVVKEGRDPVHVLRDIGDGTTVRADGGVAVPPGKDVSMEGVLRWAVDEVLKCWAGGP